jgi:hypothetical protein
MEVSLTDYPEDALDPDLIGEAVAEIALRAEEPDDVEVVLAGDFVRAVRDRIPGEQGRDDYTVDRLFGVAAARTLQLADGRTSVVVNGNLLLPGAMPRSDLLRLCAHEGLHVATYQRGETASDIRSRHGIRGMSNRQLKQFDSSDPLAHPGSGA